MVKEICKSFWQFQSFIKEIGAFLLLVKKPLFLFLYTIYI